LRSLFKARVAYCLLREVSVPLSASEILEGYGVFRASTRVYYTYVRSSAGDDWGCHGGSVGGQRLCAGQGSISVAHCIDGKDDAGIFYMQTGVCHQIANRILSSAGVNIPVHHPQVRFSHLAWGQ
jgi:rhodanese-related sulfurtransferase